MTREQRKFPRIPQSFRTAYRLVGDVMGFWRDVNTLNLSAGGMRFRDTAPLQLGTIVDLQLQLPTMKDPLALRGQVVWSQMQASGVTEYGVEFTESTPDQQMQIDEFIEFLRKRV